MEPPSIRYDKVLEHFDFNHHGRYATGSCPKCEYGNDCCTLTPKKQDDGFVIYCHACQNPQLFSYVVKEVANWNNWDNSSPKCIKGKANSQTTERQEQQRLKAKEIWDSAEPPAGFPPETYLINRRVLPLMGIPDSIRFRELLPDMQGNPHTAMVAKVTLWNGDFLGVYRTYLTKEGKKAPIPTPKAALGAIRGGSVHLAPVSDVIGLTEGIETGLAVMKLFGLPVWACLGTSGLMAIQLPPLPLARNVYIFADNDGIKANGKNPGLDAAYTLAERLKVEGREVKVIYPPTVGTDFADEAYRLGSDEGCENESE